MATGLICAGKHCGFPPADVLLQMCNGEPEGLDPLRQTDLRSVNPPAMLWVSGAAGLIEKGPALHRIRRFACSAKSYRLSVTNQGHESQSAKSHLAP